jgi:ABC-2 type transport system ATP-binding protein
LSEIAINAKGISKSFRRFKAVDAIDLQVNKGSVHGFLGPNGAGKTTVIRILLGLLTPDSAEIEILGKNLFEERREIMKCVGGIVEYPALFPYMTAYENLYYLSTLSGRTEKKLLEKVLGIVGLSKVANKKVSEFSYGMKQRLGIAQALLPDNQLIFLDEPVNGLDPHGIRDVRNLIRELAEEHGITVFLSSHLLSEVEQTCDYVTIINKGQKVCEDKVSNLMKIHEGVEINTPDENEFKNYASEKGLKIIAEEKNERGINFQVEGSEELIPEIAAEIASRGIKIYKIAKHQKILEEIFVELTGQSKEKND